MIKSLQGLRVLGMLGIFLFHSGLLLKGTFPVTFFFMLSGFVLYYSNSAKINSFNIKENLKWIRNRMKKLYPIHIITFIMSIVIRWGWILKLDTTDLFIKALLNISLLQSLVKNQSFTFNGLSWFLSTTFLLYCVAIPLILLIKNMKAIKPTYIVILILIIENIIVLINNSQNYGLNLYTTPFYRVFDFMIGMLVAKAFIESTKTSYKLNNYTLYEVGIIIIFTVMYIITLFSEAKLEYGLCYYSLIFALGIYIIAHERGVISKLLCKEVFQKIAKFSFEFYMVHELILIVFRKIFANLTYHWLIVNVIISVPALIVSTFLAIALNKYVTNKEIFSSNRLGYKTFNQ